MGFAAMWIRWVQVFSPYPCVPFVGSSIAAERGVLPLGLPFVWVWGVWGFGDVDVASHTQEVSPRSAERKERGRF